MRTLIPWRRANGGPFNLMRREVDDMFRRFFAEPVEEMSGLTVHEWAPSVDVEESEKEVLVKADLPGVDPKDVEISVTEGALVLKGEKKEEREDKKKNYHRVERFVGKFYREIPLPAGADAEKITAASTKGVITITIPKKPELVAKKIAVKNVE